jgi:hypothetical protein
LVGAGEGNRTLMTSESENRELAGARQLPAERQRSREVVTVAGSGGWLEGDGVAECFELAYVVALASFGIDALGVVVGAEIVEPGVGVR